MNKSLYLNGEQTSIIVGLLLSDSYLQRSSPTSNCRLGIQFTVETELLFYRCYEALQAFITETPRIVEKSYKGGPVKKQLAVQSNYHPVFTQFDSHFVTVVDGSRKRVTPAVSYLMKYLDGLALAFLIMGDGSRKSKSTRGMEIHTQGQGFEGAVRLCLALHEAFNILAWPTFDNHKKRGLSYWVVYISAESFEIWSPMVEAELKRCNMYDQKMPPACFASKRKASASQKGQSTFNAFYQLFKNNESIREDISYKAPSELVEAYRSIQQKPNGEGNES